MAASKKNSSYLRREALDIQEEDQDSREVSLVGHLLNWTGFGNKTLWNWLKLIISAFSIATPLVIYQYTVQDQKRTEDTQRQEQNDAKARRKQEQELAIDNQHHEIITKYLDQMTDLLLKWGLRESENGSEVQMIARARTLNTLRQLGEDGERKGQLLKFLYEAHLIDSQCQDELQTNGCNFFLNGAKLDKTKFEPPTPIFQGIRLVGASLPEAELPGIILNRAEMQKANLNKANLAGASLEQANMMSSVLSKANLSGAYLKQATLSYSFLLGANLSRANLTRAELQCAVLRGADFSRANLSGANLQRADLRKANLIGASLQEANLDRAVYSTQTILPKGLSAKERGMIIAKEEDATTIADKECSSKQ